jgi:hypothetical protein
MSCIEREQATSLVDTAKVALHRDEDDLAMNAISERDWRVGCGWFICKCRPENLSLLDDQVNAI